jgi:hypothetical protein
VPTSSTVRRPSVQPVFGRMRHRQGAGDFCMRGLGTCLGAWHMHAAMHTRARCTGRLSGAARQAVGWTRSRGTGPDGPGEGPPWAAPSAGDAHIRPAALSARRFLEPSRRALGVPTGRIALPRLDRWRPGVLRSRRARRAIAAAVRREA